MVGPPTPDPIETHLRFGMGDPLPVALHPKFVEFISHYRSLTPTPGMLPGRRHFDPLRVPKLLPHLWLIDVVPDDPRIYQVRLIGSAIVAAGGKLRRGAFFSDVMGPAATEHTVRIFNQLRESRQVDWRRGRAVLGHLEHIAHLERAICPMASDGTTVDMLLCMTLFYWTDGRVY